MIIKSILELALKPVEKILNCIGSVINQCPTADDLKQIKQSPIFNNPYANRVKKVFKKSNKAHLKTNHLAKGSVNTDSKIFNKLRK